MHDFQRSHNKILGKNSRSRHLYLRIDNLPRNRRKNPIAMINAHNMLALEESLRLEPQMAEKA